MQKLFIVFIFFSTILQGIKPQNCEEMFEGCDPAPESCINNKCLKCVNGKDVSSQCHCNVGQYYDIAGSSPSCKLCDSSCQTCEGPQYNQCLSCDDKEGLEYNYNKKQCSCVEGYLNTGNSSMPCQKCYIYGDGCVAQCPQETVKNEKYMKCEAIVDNELPSEDDLFQLIVALLIISLIIILAILLQKYITKLFKNVFQTNENKLLPLTDEESEYMKNQVEIDQQVAEILAERKRKREEEEKKRREEEAERKRLAEEEKRRKEEEERLRKLAEEERIKQEKIAQERARLKEKARIEREQKRTERQITRQQTVQRNDKKTGTMRGERSQLIKEKTEMEDFNQDCLQKAEEYNNKFEDLSKKIERSKLLKQETVNIRQGILGRSETIQNAKAELQDALKGIDFNSALQKIQSINQEDIIFLQNLRTPPERIRLCLEGVVIILTGNTKKTSWDDIKKEISNINFRRNIINYDSESMGDKVYNKIMKEYINNPQWNLSKINKASIAAGAFAEWLDAIAHLKTMKMENKPLFDKMQILQEEEAKMDKEMLKLEDLEQEEKQYEQSEIQMIEDSKNYKQKQTELQRQATLNLPDIKIREEKIEKLKTINLSLEDIQESEEEDSNSDISMTDSQILKNI